MKGKRVLALGVVAAMILGTNATVFADGYPTASTTTGTGAVENDNSVAPSYNKVVLPTVTSTTYAFTMDPSKLLGQYDPKDYVTGDSLFFDSVITSAKIEALDSKTIFMKSYVAQTDLTLLTVTATTAGSGTVADPYVPTVTQVSDGKGLLYVWVPDTTDSTTITAGAGKFVKLDETNIANYFDVTSSAANTATVAAKEEKSYLAGTNVCDGKVYKATYTAVTGSVDAEDYGTIAYDADAGYTFTPSGNLVTLDDGTDVAAAEGTDFKFTDPVTKHNKKSDKITIENKATTDTDVTVEVTLNNVEGLTFTSDSDFTDDSSQAIDANVYFAINDGSATDAQTAVYDETSKTAKLTYTKTLSKTAVDKITYQTTTVNAKTGSYDYKQYESPNPTYDKVSLYLTGVTNPGAAGSEAETNWEKYLANMTAETDATAKPTVDVVYTLKEHTGKSITNATVSSTSGVDYDVTFTKGTAMTIELSGYADINSFTYGSDVNPTGTLDSITIGADKKTVKLASNFLKSSSSGTIRYIKLTLSDSSTVVLKVTLS